MDLLKKEQNILAVFRQNEVTEKLRKELQNFHNITYTLNPQISKDTSTFDAIISATNTYADFTEDFLGQIFNQLKPGGFFIILVQCDIQKIEFLLKTSGFINVQSQANEIRSFKPTYEIGSSKKLNFSKPPALSTVWKLDDMNDDEDVEMIDPDELLDDDDFKKPEESSLRVCGTTGKRKACRDCSCGLAEELNGQVVGQDSVNTSNAKSSCGSCYLGDAFRCSGCPYLGMPAFKPGEKVALPSDFLKADV